MSDVPAMPDGVTRRPQPQDQTIVTMQNLIAMMGEKINSSFEKGFKNFSTKTADAITAPLAIVTEPLESLLGINVKSIFDKDKKPAKRNPKENDVQKMGKEGTGFLFLGNLLGRKKKKEEDDGGLMSTLGGALGLLTGGTLLKPFISKIGGTLLKAAPIGAIAGGLIWAAIDGIKGFMKSEEWGVSKISGTLGGILGGTGEGFKNAFANMGKWALIGVGIGSLAGPPGMIAGGLIGAAVGGILGLIGGQKIASGLDRIGNWFKEMGPKIGNALWNFFLNIPIVKTIIEFTDNIKSIVGDQETTIGEKIGKVVGEMLLFFPRLFTNTVEWITNFLTVTFLGKKGKEGQIVEKSLIAKFSDFVGNIGSMAMKFIFDKVKQGVAFLKSDQFKTFISDLWGGLSSSIKNFLENNEVVQAVKTTIDPILQPLLKVVQPVIDLVVWYFTSMSDLVNDLFNNPEDLISNLWNNFKKLFGIIGNVIVDLKLWAAKFVADILPGGVSGQEVEDWTTKLQEKGLTNKEILTAIEGQKGMGLGQQMESFFKNPQVVQDRIISDIMMKRQPTEVNDAIITKTGEVIHTSPDDNIIATKNSPQMTSTNSEVMNALLQAINTLSERVSQLEPKLVTVVNKGLTTQMSELKTF